MCITRATLSQEVAACNSPTTAEDAADKGCTWTHHRHQWNEANNQEQQKQWKRVSHTSRIPWVRSICNLTVIYRKGLAPRAWESENTIAYKVYYTPVQGEVRYNVLQTLFKCLFTLRTRMWFTHLEFCLPAHCKSSRTKDWAPHLYSQLEPLLYSYLLSYICWAM